LHVQLSSLRVSTILEAEGEAGSILEPFDQDQWEREKEEFRSKKLRKPTGEYRRVDAWTLSRQSISLIVLGEKRSLARRFEALILREKQDLTFNLKLKD
jgi:hypothetical protein